MMNKKLITLALGVLLALCLSVSAPLMINVINASAVNDLEVSYEYVQSEALLGERVRFPQVKAVNPEFVQSITVAVKTPSGKTVFADDKYFVPEEEGEYKFFVTVKSYGEDVLIESKKLTVTKADYPVLASEPYIPEAFVSGEVYSVPSAKFVDYNAQTPADVNYTVKYVTANGADSVVSGTFTPTALVHGDKIKLIYTATSAITGKSNVLEYSVPVLVASLGAEDGTPRYAYEKLFYSENGAELSAGADGVRIGLTKPSSVIFANKISADFSLRLLPEAANSFDNAVITVTDSENKDISVSLEIIKNGGLSTQSTLVVCGKSFTVSGSLLDLKDGIGLEFNNRSCYIKSDDGSDVAKITEADDGSSFSGFPSGSVYLKINVKTVNAASALLVNHLNKHYFDADGFDFVAPSVVQKTQLKKSAIYAGETIKVPAATSADVIDPDVTVTVSVKKEGGSDFMRDVNGTPINNLVCDKDYYFVASEPGNYMVTYTACDASGNYYLTGQNLVYVWDGSAPKISINSAIPSTVKKGGKITLPSYQASDNGKYTVMVYAVCPNSGYVMLDSGQSFTFTDKGTYYFHYCVFDEYFNFADVVVKTECV